MYQRKNLADGASIGAPGPLPAELRGLADVSLANLSWADPSLGYSGQGFVFVADPPPPPVRRFAPLVFLQRLTEAERIAIRAAARTDPKVEDLLDLIHHAGGEIDLDAGFIAQGFAYLVSQGLISPARLAQIR